MIWVAEKVIVYLHGFQDKDFDPEEKGRAIKKRLTKDGWTVYCLSYSRGKATKLSFHDSTELLVAEIKALGITKIHGVVAHSRGGIVAEDLAKRYREYGIKPVIMLESPVLGLPAWFLRDWRFLTQRRASFSWSSIQDMVEGNPDIVELNSDWPKDVQRFEVTGILSVIFKKFYKLPCGVPVKVFPLVGHSGLRKNPKALDYVAYLLKESLKDST